MLEVRFAIDRAGVAWLSHEELQEIACRTQDGYTQAELIVSVRDSSNSARHRAGITDRDRTLTARAVMGEGTLSVLRAQLVALEDMLYNSHYVYDSVDCHATLVLHKQESTSVDLDSFSVE